MLRRRLIACLCVIALAGTMAGCAKKPAPQQSTKSPFDSVKPAPITIGTLPTEDMLPFWVAEKEGLFTGAGLNVKIVVFQSAQERDTAFASGAIDAFMGDIIAGANLEAGGAPVMLSMVMLGQKASEGRFGIVAAPGSKATALKDLAGVPIATSSASIQEYVVDKLMGQAGVPADQVKKEIIPKVPVRFDLLMNGKLKAAALPEPFLSLARVQGAKVIAEDTTGENITQTVLGVSDKYLALPAGMITVRALMKVWNAAADRINKSPDSYRDLLVEKARLPEPVKQSYEVAVYPQAAPPTQAMVDPVLQWMRSKGLLSRNIKYSDLVFDLGK